LIEITVKDLLESGVHFGHQTRRWNPKMKKFIFTERNDIYIIDLQKTLAALNKACEAIREISARGESVLYVGTKPQAAAILKEEAERSGQFYITNRWLGGMLTNFRTIRQSVKRLDHLDKMSTDGTYEHLTKKEVLTLEKQRTRLNSVLSGIRLMNRLPGLLVVVDTKKENIAVSEANRLGIPVCAILDTNCDPDPITYPIPGNDDAIRSIKLILTNITDSIIEGMQLRVEESVLAEKEQPVEIPEEMTEGKPVRRKVAALDREQVLETVETLGEEPEKDSRRRSRRKKVKGPEDEVSDGVIRPIVRAKPSRSRRDGDSKQKISE
jgi:small subunit ribosomal protein S2